MDEFSTGAMTNEMHILVRMKFNGTCQNTALTYGRLVSCITSMAKAFRCNLPQ